MATWLALCLTSFFALDDARRYWQIQFAGGALFAGLLLLYGIFGMPESEVWKEKDALTKRGRHSSIGGSRATTALLQSDTLGDAEYGTRGGAGKGMGAKTPSAADMLETPKGVEWSTTKSWENVRDAANGMAAAIRKSFTDLKTAGTAEGE